MRILVVSQYYYPEPFKVHEICEELVNRGHKVTVVTGRPNYPDGKLYSGYEHLDKMHEIINGVDVYRTNISLRGHSPISLIMNYFSYPRKAKKEIQKLNEKFDIVFVYQLSPVFMIKPAIFYKEKYGKKVVTYCLDLWPESLTTIGIKRNNPIYKIFLKISNRLYKQCDNIIVTSPSFLEYLENVNEIHKDKLGVVYQHGEKRFLDVLPYSKQNKLNLVFAGNIGKAQDFDCLVKAICELPNESQNKLQVTIIGSGSYLETLQELVNSEKLEKIFIFTGRKKIEELTEYYNDASIFLLSLEKGSSISQTIPSKLQTYMSSGRGIIGSIDGPTAAIISEANAGKTCSAGDYKQLASIINELLEANDDVLQEYALNSRKYFIEHFTIEHYVDEILEVMEE